MPLTLKIVSFKDQPQYKEVTIGTESGTIGRRDSNTLVLADSERIVSRDHATVSFQNGLYYLNDTSASGTFIEYQGQEQKLHNSSQQIFDGTRLRIGEYVIAVSINAPSESSLFGTSNEEQETSPLFADELSNNGLLTDNGSALITHDNNFRPSFESELQRNQSPLSDSYVAPKIVPPLPSPFSTEDIPENFSFDDLFSENSQPADCNPFATSINQPEPVNDLNALLEKIGAEIEQPPAINISLAKREEQPAAAPIPKEKPRIEPEPIKTVVEKTVPVVTNNLLFESFLQGAAIECNKPGQEQQTETMNRIGQMFRRLIEGTIKLLRSRAEFRGACRLNATIMRNVDNNQFKTAVSANDLLLQLLENKNNGYLKPTVAIEEAFNDLMSHQLAMQAGIQASLSELLKTFDPKIIEKQFEQGVVLQKKSKCWDKYESSYPNMVEDAIEDFYGEAFVEAYEKQMRLLKQSRDKR